MHVVKNKTQDQVEVAKGGLLDRRRFLLSGATFLSVAGVSQIASQSHAKDFSKFPDHMLTPGFPSEDYGVPSEYENHVKRLPEEVYGSAIITAAFTPLDQLNGIITPAGLHFSVHHNGIPDIAPENHQFMIHGLVENALKWSVEDLLNYPMVSRFHFLECSGNSAPNIISDKPLDWTCGHIHGQISGSLWTGVPLKYLLDEAGIKPNGEWAMCEGADSANHVRNIPLKKLYDDAIIAFYQNGERIRPDQGYPMRLFCPGYEGNMSVKWLHRIEISDIPSQSKDEQSLYMDVTSDGRIRQYSYTMEVKSVITKPSGKQGLPESGLYEISGFAWSGRGKVNKVEVSADGGKTWANAHLEGPVMDKCMTRFTIPWQWDGKETVLVSRATDEFGNVQPTRADWVSRFARFSHGHNNSINSWHISPEGKVSNIYV
ncbi:sulfite dehydrogenase [Curvivirga aplysinae]|uniref:sulfite dehydrogenase n=1 Tax=Curvivirga aplysinae TaxID=2529852 RepID=UPI001C3F6CDD|nr:sulfite dehydrogenase [Curvivirga aplysinae]